mmetsp:Transcript_4061/g.11650  ORF Transcript_4061/g.11650 Transcript_4061/m.11650 type:complete len:205 (-) Transcript_4061:4855-5469(-)
MAAVDGLDLTLVYRAEDMRVPLVFWGGYAGSSSSNIDAMGQEFVISRLSLPRLPPFVAPFSNINVSAISSISNESMTSRSKMPMSSWSRLVASGRRPVLTGTELHSWTGGCGGGAHGGPPSDPGSGIHAQWPPLAGTVCVEPPSGMAVYVGTLLGRDSRPEPGIAGGSTPEGVLSSSLPSSPTKLPLSRNVEVCESSNESLPEC